MRKIKEVLRLRSELKLDQRQVARSCSIPVSTVPRNTDDAVRPSAPTKLRSPKRSLSRMERLTIGSLVELK